MKIWIEILLILPAYLIGSIPFGYILTKKFAGKNILELGSRNTGSTNVARIAGRKVSLITQICDILKGFLPVLFVYFLEQKYTLQFPAFYIYMIALSTILGHNFSIFLMFKGGKGVNTTLGATLIIAPWSVFVSILIFFIVKWKFKFVSLGSLCLGISLPLSELILHGLTSAFYYLLLCMFLIILMHRTNIIRLLNNQEI